MRRVFCSREKGAEVVCDLFESNGLRSRGLCPLAFAHLAFAHWASAYLAFAHLAFAHLTSKHTVWRLCSGVISNFQVLLLRVCGHIMSINHQITPP